MKNSNYIFIFFNYYFLLSSLSIICVWIFCNKYCHFLTFGRELDVLFFVSSRYHCTRYVTTTIFAFSIDNMIYVSFDFIYRDCGFLLFLDRYMRRDVQRKRTMRARRTRHLKWQEVQDIVCSSRRNFTHVPLSRSLQPGKERMAGKSRTVEVRFYKESRVLGCGNGGGGEGEGENGRGRCFSNICISRCR